MNRSRGRSTQFNCFSPPVMVATLIIEAIAALYTVWRYKLTVLTKLIVVCLLSLAIFQLCEYHVCTGHGLSAEDWSRLGYVAITTLPPLGLHILHVLAGRKQRRLVGAAYLSMAGFIVYFLSFHAAFIGYHCTGNYVIFQIGTRPALAYGLYYYGWLLAGIVLAMRWASDFMHQQDKLALQRMQTLRALIIGYLVFLVPTAVANSIEPSSRRGIPSIMCGFAVLFALILTFYVLPRAGLKRSSKVV